jgi:hypothetical protein
MRDIAAYIGFALASGEIEQQIDFEFLESADIFAKTIAGKLLQSVLVALSGVLNAIFLQKYEHELC